MRTGNAKRSRRDALHEIRGTGPTLLLIPGGPMDGPGSHRSPHSRIGTRSSPTTAAATPERPKQPLVLGLEQRLEIARAGRRRSIASFPRSSEGVFRSRLNAK